MRQEWTEIVIASFRDVLQRLILVTPQILAAVTLVVLGWLVAAAAGRLTTRLLRTDLFELPVTADLRLASTEGA